MDSVAEHRTLAVDGVRSPVLVAGPAASVRQQGPEAVVFVHGNNAGAKWDRLLMPVAGFARVIAPEMPGFGAADKPAQWPYTVTAYAAHLGAILDQLGVERAHLVAHDFGGPWALAWAVDHLDSVASITLINAPVVINHFAAKLWRTPFLAEALSRIGNPAVLRRVLAMRDPGLPTDALESISEHMFARGTPNAVVKLYRSTGPNALARMLIGSLSSAATSSWCGARMTSTYRSHRPTTTAASSEAVRCNRFRERATGRGWRSPMRWPATSPRSCAGSSGGASETAPRNPLIPRAIGLTTPVSLPLAVGCSTRPAA